jgi:hypothetical protein
VVRAYSPVVGEGLDEQQAAPRLTAAVGVLRCRPPVPAGVGDLDPQFACVQADVEAGLATAHPAVQGGVRGQFGDEEGGRGDEVVGTGVIRGQVLREPALGGVTDGVCAVPRGGEESPEAHMARAQIWLGDHGPGFLVHVTEGDVNDLPWGVSGAVRRVTVRRYGQAVRVGGRAGTGVVRVSARDLRRG